MACADNAQHHLRLIIHCDLGVCGEVEVIGNKSCLVHILVAMSSCIVSRNIYSSFTLQCTIELLHSILHHVYAHNRV